MGSGLGFRAPSGCPGEGDFADHTNKVGRRSEPRDEGAGGGQQQVLGEKEVAGRRGAGERKAILWL